MSDAVMKAPPRFTQSARIQRLAARSRELAICGKRRLGSADFPLGDHACWIDIGPFPQLEQMPSKVNGYEATGESWGRDYAFLVDNFPVDIYEDERVVGEIHWEMHMVRQYVWPQSVLKAAEKAADSGASGFSTGHTCPDLSIGLARVGAASSSASSRAAKSTPGSTISLRPRICMVCG